MARLRASCSLLLCLMLVAPPLAATDEVDTAGEEGTGFDEFEYIETPDLVDSKSVGAAFLHEDPEPIDTSNMSISFIHPPPGYTFTKDPYVEVGGSGIPQGYSGMLYFGSGNPFPLSLQELPLNVVISDLAPGNYSLTVIILNHERQPTEVRAETNFEFLPPNVDVKKTRSSGKFDAKVFEMSQRFHLAEVVSSGSEDDNPFLDAFRSYAKGNVDCVRCEEDEIHVSDEIYAQVAVKLFSRSSRDIEQAVDIAYHCAEMDNYNCLFLALVFDNMHQRLGLLGHDDDKFPVLEKCAKARNPLCQLALGYRYRKGISVPESCDLAAMYYRLAGDVSVMFSQEDAGNAPLHNVRLLEYTAVSAEQEKAQVEELRVVQAEQGNADAAAAVAIDRYFGTSYTGSGNNEEDKK
ncbi:hypothetical protein GUITHDRAFT_142807 [Guillardia theta CCMP2712]|uniref:Uncharacterized protein n=1 Tax=Guillardia theta (strain CCMP2712) TaxID=905079 RepID=L1IWS5_GUITC|nr:hypothetical protein GUITHDRAFT_142807 [Guillardia theta CCMP2712]EKX40304.1 hypothetical protein GUITHDRAFT_142807 [Guillardia theta CCMP2712]|eukprot:XP_005827284.1 hypothetical protein GUITHDRAFT_142807 [Guillardia theta CCMP2712]